MQLKTTLSIMEFRDRFAHKTAPEWAVGSHVTKEGLFPSGKTDRKSFRLKIGKANVNPLLPMAFGTLTKTDAGCDVSWKVRRSTGGYGLLVGVGIVAGVLLYFFGMLSAAAVQIAVTSNPELAFNAVSLSLFALVLAAVFVACMAMALFISRKAKARLEAHLREIIGEENIVSE